MKTALMISISAASMLMGVLYLNNNEPTLAPTTITANVQEQPYSQIEYAKKINQQTYRQVKFKNLDKRQETLPPSLAGLEHGIKLDTDAKGNLVINEDIKELFEFYMSAMGEESLEQIITRIQSDMSSQLRSAALNQGLSLLKRYINFKINLSGLESTSNRYAQANDLSDIEKIELQKQQLANMRLSHFDANEYQHFFAEEDEYDSFMLQHLEISQNDSIDAQQKQQQLTALQDNLPTQVQKTRKAVSLHGDLYQKTQDMKQQGASSEEVYQLRQAALGSDAAQALAELDHKRQRWQSRIDDFISAKAHIADSGLSDDDQALAINELLIQNFSGSERLRATALANL